MKSGPVKCSGCSESESSSQREKLFINNDSLWTHITMVHAAWIPYECVLCPLIMMPSDTVLNQHYQQIHPGVVPKVSFRYLHSIYTFDEEKKSLVMQLFLQSQNQSTTSTDNGTSTDDHAVEDADFQAPNLVSLRQLQQMTAPCRLSPIELSNETAYRTDDYEGEQNDASDDYSIVTINDEQEMVPQQAQMQSPVFIAERDNHVETEPMVRAITAISSREEVEKCKRVRTRNVFDCRLCERPIANHQNEHIWSRHVSKPRFACAFCPLATSVLAAIRRHVRVQHMKDSRWDAKQACWQDNTEALDEEYKSAYLAAYGRRNRKHRSPIGT